MNPSPARASAPSAETVAARALVLEAVHLRGWLEDEAVAARRLPMERALARAEQIRRWLDGERLLEFAEDGERALLAAAVGGVDPRAVLDAYWRLDALGVLAWALGALPGLPPYDAPFDPQEVMNAVPRVGEPTAAFRRDARLRADDELARACRGGALWRWRAETHARTPAPEGALESEIAEAAREAARLGALELVLDGDFAAFAEPYRRLDAKRAETLAGVARARHQALAWLTATPTEISAMREEE